MRRAVERKRVEFAPAQVIDRRVVGDLEDPGGELELGAIGLDRVERLDERLLRQVLRQLAVPHHAEEQREDRPLVAADQLTVRRLATRAGHEDDLLVAEPDPLGGVSHPAAALPTVSPPHYIERLC